MDGLRVGPPRRHPFDAGLPRCEIRCRRPRRRGGPRYGSWSMTWSTRRPKGSMPVLRSSDRTPWPGGHPRPPGMARLRSAGTRARPASGGPERAGQWVGSGGGPAWRSSRRLRSRTRFPVAIPALDAHRGRAPGRPWPRSRVAREDPRAVGPGFDRVLVQPTPDGGSGDAGHESTLLTTAPMSGTWRRRAAGRAGSAAHRRWP